MLDLKAVLTEFGGFRKSEITTLIDKAATQEAMMKGIKNLDQGIEKGDVALPDLVDINRTTRSIDEADGRDETLLTDLDWYDPMPGRLVAPDA